MASPRDRFLTIYGRRPVLEALADESLTVDKVVLDERGRGPELAEIERVARRRGVDVRRASAADVTRLSRNGRQDQGVAADVIAPSMRSLEDFEPATSSRVLVLDGITNPANVGQILRTTVASGFDGIVVPTAGVADIGPLVVKASAGYAFRAPILRARTAADAVDALRDGHGFRIYGLDSRGGRSLFDDAAPFAGRSAFVLGGEHEGLSVSVHETVGIPMTSDVDSINVAAAAAVLCFELVRRDRC